jgi:serine/threonine-protein kinase
MRYVEGTDLKTLIRGEGPLGPERTISILSQAASALDAAHREGLIHRDVKPGNILLTPRTGLNDRDRVYLSDFGLTKRASSDSGITATGQFVGTLDYAAPEQFENKPLDARTDVYSLGCVLYECLTGEVPFSRDNEAALVYAHLMGPPPKVTDHLADLPGALDGVVSKAMAKSPEDRYQSAGELIDAAANALGIEAVTTATPMKPREVQAPPRRRSPVLVGGVAVIALALLGLFVAMAVANRGTKSPGTIVTNPPAAVLAGYLARYDPASGNVASITVGKHPRGIAIGEGSAWVTDVDSNSVSRVDPATSRVTVTIKVGKDPIAIIVDQGAVWVANIGSLSISRIDPATNRVVKSVALDLEPSVIAAGDGVVWVADWVSGGYVVEKIDQASGRVLHTTEIDTKGSSANPTMSVGGGSVWIGSDEGILRSIDPDSGKVVRQFQVGVAITSIDAEGDSVWVGANGTPGTVFELDAHSGKVLARIPAGGGLGGLKLTAHEQSVWVTDTLNGTVSRIAIISGQSSPPTDVGKVPVDLAVGLGSVWVTVDSNGAR